MYAAADNDVGKPNEVEPVDRRIGNNHAASLESSRPSPSEVARLALRFAAT